jgi:hypothetical protein
MAWILVRLLAVLAEICCGFLVSVVECCDSHLKTGQNYLYAYLYLEFKYRVN